MTQMTTLKCSPDIGSIPSGRLKNCRNIDKGTSLILGSSVRGMLVRLKDFLDCVTHCTCVNRVTKQYSNCHGRDGDISGL